METGYNTFVANSVISSEIQQKKQLKLKAFLLSVFLHASLLAMVVKLADESFTHTTLTAQAKEKTTLISLSSYQVVPEKPKVVKKRVVKKPIVKEIVKKVVKKETPKPNPIEKKIEKQTLQETQQTQALVESPEAFTPQLPDTEQVVKEEIKPQQKQNSPLSEFEFSQLDLIRSLIQNALKYPAIARRLHLEGVVVVSFSLSTTGEVSNLQLVQSSNSSVLDKRALQTVSSLDGEFPQLNKKVDLKIPIAFSLQQS